VHPCSLALRKREEKRRGIASLHRNASGISTDVCARVSSEDRNLRIAKNSVIGLVFRIVKWTRGREGQALMRVMLQLRARARAFRCAFPFRGGCEILEAYAAVATFQRGCPRLMRPSLK